MIAIKGGTKTWSDAKQTSSLKDDGVQQMSATERQKFMGDNKDLGKVLNKIADPNWVDPANMRKVGGDELGKDAFLKLLLAQLKNQDPTSPLESHEMAAQLAQFTSLEKLQSIDDSIGAMAKADDPSSNFATLSLIGKGVMGDSTVILRNDSTESHDINFRLGASAKEVELTIKDSVGNVVKTLNGADLEKGANKISWNGINDEGAAMGKGTYRVELKALDGGGRKVAAETKFAGVITGVNFEQDGPVLMMGNQKVRMNDVRSIFDASQAKAVNKAKVVNNSEKKTAEVAQAGSTQLQDNVAMSREMMNKVEKELGDKK